MMICVTNRLLCPDDFLPKLERIASRHPDRIVLREKDLPEDRYEALARECLAICRDYQVAFTIHSYPDVARRLGVPSLHLPLHSFLEQRGIGGELAVGTSIHSMEEARLARENGAAYLIAGHIYATGCKPGLEPRGTAFLQAVVQAVDVPVYAIGGITPDNLPAIRASGAAGYCVMSSLMQADDPCPLMDRYREMWRTGPQIL